MKKFRILVIDDDDDDQFFIKEAFENTLEKVTIEFASNGLDIVQKMENQVFCPDLIILDLNMPEITGLEVLSNIRSSDSCHSKPVIILTTSSNPSDINQAYKLGANSFIIKPNSQSEFTEIAKSIVSYWSLSVIPSH